MFSATIHKRIQISNKCIINTMSDGRMKKNAMLDYKLALHSRVTI